MIAAIANSAWVASCIPDFLRFRNALTRVRSVQQRVLQEIIGRNSTSEFGRAHGFCKIRSPREFQQRVPVRDYEGFRAYIDRIAAGERSVLTEEPVRLFQPTSGSAGAKKWIPHTHSLEREFQRGIRAWVADMFLHTPELIRGPAYWSVSPADDAEHVTASGIRVGFADDSEYVGGFQKRLVQSVMAVPSSVRSIRDSKEFWYATLLNLVRRRDLRFISVWNPSFLTLLMNRLAEFAEQLAKDVPSARVALSAGSASERHQRLWPRLRVISCWTDANSAGAARHLEALFPHARLQSKGLIATEGFVSLPWIGTPTDGASALAICSHFFEFLPVSSSGDVDFEHAQLAHALDYGQLYSVVLSTGGGLYRYDLGDRIEVEGRASQCPLIRFMGRSRISDWFGEKLHEVHVARVLESTFREFCLTPAFAMLACDAARSVPAYVLYIDAKVSEDRLRDVARSLDEKLEENFHYRYARRLGQLGPLRIFAARSAEASYVAACTARGQLAGDVKHVALDPRGDWTSQFQGEFVETEAAAGVSR